jgi:glyoxylase-like metal-dependent hydrolase (beta-lactamase superfamily II)
VREGFPVHHTISGGSELDLGNGVTLHAINAPGHSVCSLAFYLARERALFPSDSMGTLKEKGILPMGSSNYDDFQETIERLCKIGAEIFCFETVGALTPPEGMEFCERAKREATELRVKMIETYQKSQDIEATAEEIAKELYRGSVMEGFLAEDLFKGIVARMVRFVNRADKD